MNTKNVMRDGAYAPILLAIEGCILTADRVAKELGVNLTDSQVRSVLNKVRKSSTGANPQMPTGSIRDQMFVQLHEEILKARSKFALEFSDGQIEGLPTSRWILSLRTIEDSIRLRSVGPGSRAYLEFLDDFLEEVTD